MARLRRVVPSSVLPRLSALVAAAALLALPIAAVAADQAVSISGFAFHPASVTVNVGDTVTWTNNDGISHTATADDGSTFNTGAISSGASASATFNSAGTFAYHCTVHPSMHGTVLVRAASAGGGGGGGVPGTDTLPAPTAPDGAPLAIAMLLAWAAGGLIGLRLLRRVRGSR
jgi:plastocyanin